MAQRRRHSKHEEHHHESLRSEAGGLARWSLMRIFGVSSPFAIAVYLASYLGFRPAGENTPPPNSNEANAKQFVEALKKVRDALGHAATKPARTDRGAGRVAVSDALEPKTVVETTGIDEYRHFFDFEAPPKVATRPNPGRPIEMPSSPPPPPKKKRSSFEFDGSPYR